MIVITPFRVYSTKVSRREKGYPPKGHGRGNAYSVSGEGTAMDRAELSEESIHELGALFVAALREAAADVSVADLDGVERRVQAVGRQVLGPVVERVLAVRAAHEGLDRLPCTHCGGPLRRWRRARRACWPSRWMGCRCRIAMAGTR